MDTTICKIFLWEEDICFMIGHKKGEGSRSAPTERSFPLHTDASHRQRPALFQQ
jgi:hypothetical protein